MIVHEFKKTDSVIPEEIILKKIFFVRGKKVMLDEDLAELYHVETRRLNEQVKRNMERFPIDFAFQLTNSEYEILISQFATSSWGGRRKLPIVFTELGVAMLSSVLNSKKAIQVNIEIMRIFTRIKSFVSDNTELQLSVEKLERKTDGNSKSIELLFEYIDELQVPAITTETESRRKIGFKIKQKKNPKK